MLESMLFRSAVLSSDVDAVRDITLSTGFFSDEEVGIAVELVEERLAKGEASGYYFLFAQSTEPGADVAGYTCFGPIPGTESSWDLYWIAVRDSLRGQGIGRVLMDRTERAAAALGATRMYVDTSSREQYASTRRFYESCGYKEEALLEDFYHPGDSKVVYVKKLAV